MIENYFLAIYTNTTLVLPKALEKIRLKAG